MRGVSDEISRRIPSQEDLRPYRIPHGSEYEIHGHSDGFLGLTADIAGGRGTL